MFQSSAQVVSGRITNQKNEAIPYATIFVQEAKSGTITNSDGNFKIQLPRGTYHFTIRSLGYVQIEKPVIINSDSLHIDITLQIQDFQIKEVKVFPGKEDPAYFIMRKAISKAPFYRSKIKHYSAGLYIKSNFAFTNIPKIYQNKIEVEGKKLKEVMKENVTYVIESQNEITFDYPNHYNQKVISKKTSLVGFDEPPVLELMTTSFYEERPNQVISPLSSLALRHYNFQYEGFITVGNFDVFKIKVTPKRKSDELITGYIYIIDKLWCIYNLDFNISFEFFDYRVKQQFENLGNNNWLPVSHIIDGKFSMLGLKGLLYYGAALKYNTVEDNKTVEDELKIVPESVIETPSVKNEKEKQLQNEVSKILEKNELTNADVKKAARLNRKILKEQYNDSTITAPTWNNYKVDEQKDSLVNNEEFWDTIRAIPLSPAEIRSYAITDSLVTMRKADVDSITGKKTFKEKSLFRKIIGGHPDFAKDSLITINYEGLISPENFDFNTVDGYKYKQKLQWSIQPDSGKTVRISPEIGYAFSRKVVFGSVKMQFTNVLFKNSNLLFDFGKESRDFKPGSIGIPPALNEISSWFFAKNYMKLYETSFATLDISQRIKKNFTVSVSAGYNHFSPLKNNISYILSDKKEYSLNLPKGYSDDSPYLTKQKSFNYSLVLNYRKRQRKPWMEKSPFLFLSDFYTADLSFKQAIKNVFSSVSDFSQVDFSFHQQANLTPSSGIEWQINAGHFFKTSQMHFSQFKHFQTSEIPVLFSSFSNSFQLLNDYEFSTNKDYLQIGAEFRNEYILLRYFSFINQKTWSESLHLNYLTTLALKNYWETGYSLNSLFFVGNVGIFAGFKGRQFENVMLKISISGFE